MQQLAEAHQECSKDAKQISPDVIDKLFIAFAGVYGDKWAKQFDSDKAQSNAQRQWFIALRKFSEDEIKLGFTRIRDEDNRYASLPSVARFKFLAKGLIDTEKAFELALMGDYSMVAIKSTIYRIGETAFRKLSEIKAKERFARIYALICDDIIAGNDVLTPEAPVRIEYKHTSNKAWLMGIGNRLGEDAYIKAKTQLELYDQNKSLYVQEASEKGLINYAKSMVKS